MRVAIWMILVAGCGSGSAAAPDAAPSCADLQQSFATAAATLDQSCDVDGDCASVGGKDILTCDCEATLPVFVVNGAAYAGSPADAIARQFYAQCALDPNVVGGCDEAPVFTHCSNHVCVKDPQSCQEPDAGP